jgi:RND family efflux transporter MFP subunit
MSGAAGGWIRFVGILVLAIAALGVLGVLRAEQEQPPVPTQADLQGTHGVPVEVTDVRRGLVSRSLRLYGTIEGERQSEIVVPSPNVLQRIHVAVGDSVVAHQQLATMRDVALSPLGFRLGPLKAQHEAAQADLARIETLHAQGGVTDQQVEHARAMARAAQADYEAALATIHITSPIAGVVTRIDFREGELVPNDRPLMQVAAIDQVALDLMTESTDVVQIREGHEVEVGCTALPGRVFRGEVTERSMGAYPVINQFRVRVAIPNPERALLPGYPVQANVRIDSAEDGLVVPLGAVFAHEDGSAVWRVETDGTASLCPVKVGVSTDAEVAVVGGLTEGDRVVTLGGERIPADGARLVVVAN